MNQDLQKGVAGRTDEFISDIRGNLAASGTDATLESSKSIHYDIKDSDYGFTIEVLAKPFFSVVETGRKPTPGQKPGRDMITNLYAWLDARGKPDNLVWAIAMSIMKKGTALFRKGGRTDIYTDLKNPFVKDIGDLVAKYEADAFMKSI